MVADSRDLGQVPSKEGRVRENPKSFTRKARLRPWLKARERKRGQTPGPTVVSNFIPPSESSEFCCLTDSKVQYRMSEC